MMVLPGFFLEIIWLRVEDTLSHVREAQGTTLWEGGIIQPGEDKVEGQFNNHLQWKTKHLLNALREEVLVIDDVKCDGRGKRISWETNH